MSIRDLVTDAESLRRAGRWEGAFALALISVGATSKRAFPEKSDRQAFEDFLQYGWFKRMQIEFRGELHPINHVFYKWFRCELVHVGSLPVDVEFIPDPEPGVLRVRAGGAPHHVLQVSYGWFDELIRTVVLAEVNRDLFDRSAQPIA